MIVARQVGTEINSPRMIIRSYSLSSSTIEIATGLRRRRSFACRPDGGPLMAQKPPPAALASGGPLRLILAADSLIAERPD
jgi:hypothetical protein